MQSTQYFRVEVGQPHYAQCLVPLGCDVAQGSGSDYNLDYSSKVIPHSIIVHHPVVYEYHS